MFELPTQTVAAGLAHYVATNPDIASFEGQINGSAIGTIIHQGIAFDVQVTGALREFCPVNRVFCDADPSAHTAIFAIDLSDNVKGGEVVAGIIKALLSLCQKIGEALGAVAVYWRPADIVSGFGYFTQAVRGYDGGGVFPVLALIHFDSSNAASITSKGLAYLCEQEIAFSPGSMSTQEAMRRVVRVAHDLATNGPVRSPIELLGMEAGERLLLAPDHTRRILNVQISSKMEQ
jgi:hypothetical protein